MKYHSPHFLVFCSLKQLTVSVIACICESDNPDKFIVAYLLGS